MYEVNLPPQQSDEELIENFGRHPHLGYPTDVLARLWLAHDIAHRSTDVEHVSRESQGHQAWKTFDDSM